ncbi:MAG TPA: hypothetical protein DCX12_07145 [Chloroflexi bacterium]|nr:hypothetical protein [Chloroflexota bacterium]
MCRTAASAWRNERSAGRRSVCLFERVTWRAWCWPGRRPRPRRRWRRSSSGSPSRRRARGPDRRARRPARRRAPY